MKWMHRYHYVALVIIMAIIVVVGTLCFLWLNNSSAEASVEAVTDVSEMYLQEISAQKIGHIQTSIEGQFTSLNMIIEAITEEDLQDEDSLQSFLSRAQDMNQLTFLALIDDRGNYHSSTGIYPVASKIASFGTLLNGKRLISYDESISGDDMLLFGTDISPISYDGYQFFAIVAGYNRDNMSDMLTISADNNVKAHSKVYGADGRLVAECRHDEKVSLGNNLFSGLKKYAKFEEDYSLATIQNDFLNGGEGMTICDIENESYYLYYAPIEDTDWYVTIILSYKSINQSISEFATTLKKCAILVVCVVVAVLLTGFLFYAVGMTQATKETEKSRRQAERANQAKSEFLSHMSHDIRTPINGIIGMTNIAMRNEDNKEKVEDCIQKISEASGHLLMLVNDVLDMSRIESGKIVISNNPLDMHALIQSCVAIINGQIMSRQLEFECEFEDSPNNYLFGDELHLRQILINILGNAVKFTPDGGKIRFQVAEQEERDGKAVYLFEIEDNGIGMSEEFQEHIFEAFSQEDNGSRTHYAGTGLGMAITKQFVDLMGGNIRVESEVAKGSKFTVELAFDIDFEKKTETQVQEETENVNIAGMRILLVEDNELNMEIAQELLEAEGAKVSVSMNGQEALDKFLEMPAGSFDVILMDIMMPVMNGYDAARAIRASKHPDAATIPIIAMTANAYEEDVKAALNAGMNAHVAKPIDMEKFFAVISGFR